jgi:hypothetical protein
VTLGGGGGGIVGRLPARSKRNPRPPNPRITSPAKPVNHHLRGVALSLAAAGEVPTISGTLAPKLTVPSGAAVGASRNAAKPSRVITGTSITSRNWPLRMITVYLPSGAWGATWIKPDLSPTCTASVSGSTT